MIGRRFPFSVVVVTLLASPPVLYAQTAVGTAFTYQGQLKRAGEPVDDTADFEFTLWDAETGGAQVGPIVPVDNWLIEGGLFTVLLDFGEGVFTGDACWLEIAVRSPAGSGDFTTLSPRQPMSATPYALYAVGAGYVGDAWSLGGNAGTDPDTQFLGTTDDRPLVVRVNGAHGLRIEPNPRCPNLVAGHQGNTAASGVVGAAIGGGGEDTQPNLVNDNFGTVAGGWNNRAGDSDGDPATRAYATVGGGGSNFASGTGATIGGGLVNDAGGLAATVGGGEGNWASTAYATVAGGGPADPNNPSQTRNRVNDDYGAIGGGGNNQAGDTDDDPTNSRFATVSGGVGNVAGGLGAVVGGGIGNQVTADYGTIAGGGRCVPSDPDTGNIVTDNYGTVGGGGCNQAGDAAGTPDDSAYATVAGGVSNIASGARATVGGGVDNEAVGLYAVVAGGRDNDATGASATVSGGYMNGAIGDYTTVSGGLWSDAIGDFATVGGGRDNWAEAPYGTIAGGGNSGSAVYDSHGVIGGGGGNIAGTDNGDPEDSTYATIAGGQSNIAAATHAAIGGGQDNEASGWAATIGGGLLNAAQDIGATVAGGIANEAQGPRSTVGGGGANVASGEYATVPGGYCNSAGGNYSFAAGKNAKADHLGSFVWADSYYSEFLSLRDDQFRVRAHGGAGFNINDDYWVDIWMTEGKVIRTSTGAYLSAGGAWTDNCDRARKQDFRAIDGGGVLDKVLSLPLGEWLYKAEAENVRHLGPVAQDFHAAFGLGADDTHIAPLDTAGVALAAIQGLHQVVQEKDRKIATLEHRVAQLEEIVGRLVREERKGYEDYHVIRRAAEGLPAEAIEIDHGME